MHLLRSLVCLFFLYGYSLPGVSQVDSVQVVVQGRVNAKEQITKPYVILISVDGLRSDYARKFQATNLLRLGQLGATADYMLPCYPSLTFPNHYSIVTGLYPAHHGLVDNTFYDPAIRDTYQMHDSMKVRKGMWYGGTPLWVLAEQQKMISASFFWVGSEAPIQSILPTYYYHYANSSSLEQRLGVIRHWLTLPEENRPHLITVYFPQVDHAGHDHGPDAKETRDAVLEIDQAIGRLAFISDSLKLPVNFIVVSDHGMATVDTENPITLPSILKDTTLCKLTFGNTLAHAYVKNKADVEPLYKKLLDSAKGFDVYRAHQVPEAWRYDNKNDAYHRIGDIILVAKFPKVFKTGSRKTTPGKHGFDPAMPEMHATFIAWGPQIKKAGTIPAFRNIHVFPFVANLLGLTYSFKVDGEKKVLNPILR